MFGSAPRLMRVVTALVLPAPEATCNGVYPSRKAHHMSSQLESPSITQCAHTFIIHSVNSGTQFHQVLEEFNEVVCCTIVDHSLSGKEGYKVSYDHRLSTSPLHNNFTATKLQPQTAVIHKGQVHTYSVCSIYWCGRKRKP